MSTTIKVVYYIVLLPFLLICALAAFFGFFYQNSVALYEILEEADEEFKQDV